MNTTRRDTYFDFLRGIAIMLVVANHTKVSSDIHSLLGVINAAMTCAVSPAVPMFLAISGYFLSRKMMETRHDYFMFLRRQLPTVYLPCLFWSVFHFALYIRGGNPPVKGIILFFTCGLSVYYFIAGIMQCYVLLPLVRRIRLTGVLALLAVACAWIGCHTYLLLVQGNGLPLLVYGAPFPNLLVWFALGCYLGQNGNTNYRALPIAVATLVALMCSGSESYYIHSLCGRANQDWKITAYLFDFFAVLLAFSQPMRSLYRENRFTRLIARLGVASFAVYLTHILVKIVIFKIVPSLGSCWVVGWAAVILSTWLFVEVLKRLVPARLWKYLGLR